MSAQISMKTFREGDRVADGRPKHQGDIGTVCADSDPISRLVRIQWDRGGSSLVFVQVLDLADEIISQRSASA